MMEKTKINEIIADAVEIAVKVPEHFQSAAFDHSIRLLTIENFETTKKPQRSISKNTNRNNAKGELPSEKLVRSIDRTKYTKIKDLKTVKSRSLFLLKIAKEDLDRDGLSSPEIAKILSDKFNLKTTRQAVDGALKADIKLVNRVQSENGKVYFYKISDAGIKHIEKLIKELGEE